MKKEISIYIHIPFCEKKCAYCAFASFVTDEQQKQRYVNALCNEIERRKFDALDKNLMRGKEGENGGNCENGGEDERKSTVKSVYFGGGTPSVLSAEQFAQIFEALRKNFSIKKDAEITIEANPNSVTLEKMEFWKSLGVNRISLGVQSLDDQILRKIGRLHTAEQAISCVKMAKKVFENVSCDLLVGFENDLTSAAEKLIDAGAVHVSCYLLEVYKETKISQMIENGQIYVQNEEQTMDTFENLCNFLGKKGLERYEISNFAFKGFESKHNMNYWARGEYLGFGLSAHSFVGEKRIWNASNVEDYYKNITKCEVLSRQEANEEKIMLGLRCKLGVKKSALEGYDISKNPNFLQYIKSGVLTENGDKIFLNPKFYGVSNTIISNLFEK